MERKRWQGDSARSDDKYDSEKSRSSVLSRWLWRNSRHAVMIIMAVAFGILVIVAWLHINPPPGKLLVISVSGFRWDYLGKVRSSETPFFTRFLKHGAQADWLEPAFPSAGIVSQASMFTGLYPAEHGILGEHFMDKQHGDLAVDGPSGHSADDRVWWAYAKPFWITSIEEFRDTAVLNVHGACIKFEGHEPNYCQAPVKDQDKFSENLSRALDLLVRRNYHVSIVHTDVLKKAAEHYGPDSTRVLEELQTLDARLEQMDRALAELGVIDKVNIVIVSDGGLTDVHQAQEVILDQYLPHEVGVTAAGNGASCMIYTDDQHLEQVFQAVSKIPGTRAYRRRDIPARYRMDHPTRSPDILLVAEPGHYIENDMPIVVSGAGGYDDTDGKVSDMRGVLMGRGPSFGRGVMVRAVHASEVYGLLTYLLNIRPEVSVDLGEAAKMLR